ncbi:adenylate cyclase domain protein [Mycobacterium kansasii 824]|nr:adenylate cyclase domain protein [Mycobacterium kansasii 824]
MPDETATAVAPSASRRRSPGQWLRSTNHSPGVVAFIRRARRLLPGDPEFGDPLSTAGDGGPRPRHGLPTGCWGIVMRPRVKSAWVCCNCGRH